jgi:transcriptional regulator with XRE-family HTH domain
MPKARRRDPDAVLFGWVIKRLREERGWSIATLARRTFINPTHLGVLERGGNIPSLTTILLLGNALGIDGSEIVREVEQMRREAAQRRLAAKKAQTTPTPPPDDELKSS